VAERRSHSSGDSKPPSAPDRPVRALTLKPGRHLPPPANDNKAPLPTRLRRLLPFALLLCLLLLLWLTAVR
jgi:hypothetical protein